MVLLRGRGQGRRVAAGRDPRIHDATVKHGAVTSYFGARKVVLQGLSEGVGLRQLLYQSPVYLPEACRVRM